ncbi:DeoR/GlpR family DNA-binding transcription regulator [Cryptosporangium japonicum]|uniref:DeoR/GlpR family DNA-binding transcription regulator n=1 Tax=Cryptosporangium japonicum TaxID=80872 RepID=A0ABP3EM84_9ACTN
MLIAERRSRILAHVRARGWASFREIAEEVGISESTVRRDLQAMVAEGLVDAVRGGVGRAGSTEIAPPESRPAGNPAGDGLAGERAAIARYAARLVTDGSAILLGPGRSTLELARRLTGAGSLTVVTNSVPVTTVLLEHEHVELVMVGGTLRRSIQAFVGPLTEQGLQGLRGAQVFLSGDGVTAERGLTTPNVFAAAADIAFAAAGKQVVVLADHTKIGQETMCQTVPSDRIDTLITTPGADPVALEDLRASGVDVVIAPPLESIDK